MRTGCRVGFYPTFGTGLVVEGRGVKPHPTIPCQDFFVQLADVRRLQFFPVP